LMLVGMAGVMSGAMYAPLTAIFLIAETSSGYDLFIPLMIVSVIAFAINKFFSPINPVYSKLAEKGEIFTTRQDQNILSHINLRDCVNIPTSVVDTSDSMEVLLQKFKGSKENIMAVIDENNHFWGIINRSQLTSFLIGKVPLTESNVSALTLNPAYIVACDDSVMKVTKMFDQADVWQFPILNEKREFEGFVSRSQILTNYRTLLKNYSE
ncbi:MAG: CIC family chloride channel protein, partial [Psychromonas sp.]